jgi:hypothetical protein
MEKREEGKRRGLKIFTRSEPVIGGLQRTRKGTQPQPNAEASAALPEFYAAGGVASANLFVDPDGTEDACLNLLWLKLGSNFTIPRHNHTGDCLYYVASGSVRLGNQVIEAGGGFFVPSAAPYTYSAGPEGAEVLEFRGALQPIDTELLDNDWDGILEGTRANKEQWAKELVPFAQWARGASVPFKLQAERDAEAATAGQAAH